MYKYNSANIVKARQLRRNMTHEELVLWCNYLRSHQYKFRRQHPIGNYILDFYCPKLKLAIELDGSQHATTDMEYDKVRSGELRALGITVLRFSNLDIRNNLRGVCEYIDRAIINLTK